MPGHVHYEKRYKVIVMGKHRAEAKLAPMWHRMLGVTLSLLGATVALVGALMVPGGFTSVPYTGAYIPLAVYAVGAVMVLVGVSVQVWLTRHDKVKNPLLGALLGLVAVMLTGAALTMGSMP